jgi:hypothetical protein
LGKAIIVSKSYLGEKKEQVKEQKKVRERYLAF